MGKLNSKRIRLMLTLSLMGLSLVIFGIISGVSASQRSVPELKWSFEKGVLSPFQVVEGEFGEGIIAAWNLDRNGSGQSVNKHGSYYLCTVETDTTTANNELFTGTIKSPKFKIMGPLIQMKLAGGISTQNYVAVLRVSDDVELARISVPGGNSHIFREVEMDLGDNYTKNEEVYLKIVDGTTSNWGFISVDDIRAKGTVAHDYVDIQWGFESGEVEPFVTQDTFGKLIVDRDNCRNGTGPMKKEGTYYLSTVEVNDPNQYNESFRGSIVSPVFYLDPQEPEVNLKISGGTNAANYVAVCDEKGNERVKVSPVSNGHPFNEVTLDLSGHYTEGEGLYIKIVDGTTAGWGFIQVDDFRLKGALKNYTYEKVRWSFETGTEFPFVSNDTFGKLIVDRDVCRNDKVTSMNKHGQHYLSTVEVEDPNSYNEGFTGNIQSPRFLLDPSNPIIQLKLSGGANANNYVALCRASDDSEMKKVSPSVNGHPMQDVTIDVSAQYVENELVYIKIVDGTTSGWGFIQVDDLTYTGTVIARPYTKSQQAIENITGWNEEKFGNLKLVLTDLLTTYEDTYTTGEFYLQEVNRLQGKFNEFIEGTLEPTHDSLLAFANEMNTLEHNALTSNPLLTQSPILFVTRYQYKKDHHNTHNMFPSYAGEINSASYTAGGAIKVVDFGNDKEVSMLKQNTAGVFRDPDVAYDGNKFLISYRENLSDTYNIYEYTLTDDKKQIANEKKLTAMDTADDMDPLYLPSGDIVFAATRDPKYVMCNRHISSNLYRMEEDGANIVKITNSTLFERPTDVLEDGSILYDRWEYNDRDFGSAQGLWTVYPDGTQQVTYYGNNTPTGAYIDGKLIPGTQNVMAVLSSTHDMAWGGLGIIDRSKGVDGRAPIVRTWPKEAKNQIDEPGDPIEIDAFVGLSIKYEDPLPLSDKYFIVSRQIPGKGQKMGLYLLDVFGNETLVYEDSTGMGAYDAQLLKQHDKEFNVTERRNYKNDPGTFYIQNVYEGTHMEGVSQGEVKSLRIVESMPKNYISQSQQWGGQGQQNPAANWHSFELKRVIGEVPVYEDGSAFFEVPQDVFVYFQLLDEEGRMIQSMRTGTLVQSGERTGCIGCHEDRRKTPLANYNRKTPLAMEESVTIIPNPDWEEGLNVPKTLTINMPDKPQKKELDFVTGVNSSYDYDDSTQYSDYEELPTMNYLTEVQPIFTGKCISCHGYENPKGGLTLVPDKTPVFNASYIDLWRGRNKNGVRFGNMLGVAGGAGTEFAPAKSWGSHSSPLVNKIYNDAAHSQRLTAGEKRRISEWVDLNAPYYGDYSTNYGHNPGGRSPLTQAELGLIGHNWGFHWTNTQPAQVYFDNPEKSPLLRSGLFYNTRLNIIRTGLNRLRQNPDIDWKGLTHVPGNPSLTIEPWAYNGMDAWRREKVEIRRTIENNNREAIKNGTKRYDWDNVIDWPTGAFPGWPSITNPLQ